MLCCDRRPAWVGEIFGPAVGGDWRAASMASSNCASSCGDEAATRPPGPRREGSAHHCQVSEPNQTSEPGWRRARSASASRIADMKPSGNSGWPGTLCPAHKMSAHTTRPRASPLTPLRADNVFTISRPRPSSRSESSMTRGPSGAPLSKTATRTICAVHVTSTANLPWPLTVWRTAFVHSSTATLATSSRDGHGGSNCSSHRRSAPI